MDEFDHRNTSLPVCPYCGYEHQDAWEWEDDTTHECCECEKEFHCSRLVDITYNTKKV